MSFCHSMTDIIITCSFIGFLSYFIIKQVRIWMRKMQDYEKFLESKDKDFKDAKEKAEDVPFFIERNNEPDYVHKVRTINNDYLNKKDEKD